MLRSNVEAAGSSLRAAFRPGALRRGWPLALAVVVLAVLMAGFSCSRHGRPALASAFLLPDMMIELPVRPVTWFTDEPVVERVTISYEGGEIVADVYRPGDDGRHAAVIFSMGAPPLDLDDSRLVKLAEDAARAGLVFIVPFSERLDDERAEVAEIDALVGIYEFAERQAYVDPDRVGYIGVSVGGSLALVAAEDARIAERVDFVVSFGGYYNALDTFEATGSRHITYDGVDETWEPDDHTIEVVALQLLRELPDEGDRAVVCKAYVDQWDWHLCDTPVPDFDPVDAADIAGLTPAGRIVFDFMRADPAEIESLSMDLPQAALEKLVALSPDHAIDGLGESVELFIIHDRGDKFVPYVESRRLRDAVVGRDDVHYTEVSLFEHVEPRLSRGGNVIVMDSVRLYFRLYQLLLKLT